MSEDTEDCGVPAKKAKVAKQPSICIICEEETGQPLIKSNSEVSLNKILHYSRQHAKYQDGKFANIARKLKRETASTMLT